MFLILASYTNPSKVENMRVKLYTKPVPLRLTTSNWRFGVYVFADTLTVAIPPSKRGEENPFLHGKVTLAVSVGLQPGKVSFKNVSFLNSQKGLARPYLASRHFHRIAFHSYQATAAFP